MRRITCLVLATVLALALLSALAVPAMAVPARSGLPPLETDGDLEWIDGTYMLGEKDQATRRLAAKIGTQAMLANSALQAGPAASAVVGGTFTVDVSDNSTDFGGTYTETFVVQSIGTRGIICITQDAYNSFDGTYYRFANPHGDDSEKWLRTVDLITPSQLSYMLNTFDTTIWNTMKTTFGTPLPRGAEGDKVWILIFNIKDDAYYDPSAESYIAGYFSYSEGIENNKNMMHIDTYDWINRIGGDAARPYLYEGVFAHEYQHLLHADVDPDEESWVDEGMADHAAFLCGFMEDTGHVQYFIYYHPYTALTFFGGNLQDYGACYLFQLYLWEQYGGDAFTKALFNDQANGIEGVQNQLNAFGGGVTFDEVFDDWTLTNYFDETFLSPYQYRSIALGPDTEGLTFPDMVRLYHGANAPFFDMSPQYELWLPLGTDGEWFYYDYFGLGTPMRPYTTHYYLLDDYRRVALALDGSQSAGIAPYSGDNQYASGAGTWAWKSISQTFAIPAAGSSKLSFWTWFDIEPDWDYAYVEIYDHTASQWSTLQILDDSNNPISTSTLPFPQDNPNVPTAQEPSTYEDLGRWNALTGYSDGLLGANSDGWIHANADLTPFAGRTVTIYLRTWQDGAFTYQMINVDDISVDLHGVISFTDFESGNGGWTTPAAGDTSPWALGAGLYGNDWQGTLVQIYQPGRKMRHSSPAHPLAPILLTEYVTNMNATTQDGVVRATGTTYGKLHNWLYIVSNRADHFLPADYYLEGWVPTR